METTEILETLEAELNKITAKIKGRKVLSADVGDLDTVQACDAQLSHDAPISGQALRLKAAIDKSGGRVIGVIIGVLGISIQLDWEALKELSESVGEDLHVYGNGGAVHASMKSGAVQWTAFRKLEEAEILKLAELI
tara:strand:- start:2323 stop:2733 length:411 start_codon:yes stop_codon:yes gene_type:complete